MDQESKTGFTALVIEDYRRRPLWMNLIFYFCLYMTFVYMPFDMFFKPVDQDHEIWFGFTLTGWWAKATEPLHWLIYGLGAYGFRHMKPWMWPWAGVYAAQVVIGDSHAKLGQLSDARTWYSRAKDDSRFKDYCLHRLKELDLREKKSSGR